MTNLAVEMAIKVNHGAAVKAVKSFVNNVKAVSVQAVEAETDVKNYGTAVSKIKGKVRSAITATQNWIAKLKGLKGASDGAGRGLKGIASKITAFAGAALLFSGLSVGIGSVAKSIMEVEVAQSQLQAVTNLEPVSAQFQKLNNEAERLGASTQYTTTQAFEAMTTLGSLGFQVTEILQGSAAAVEIAGASFGTVGIPEAAGAMGAAIKGFGLEMENAGHVANVFARSTQLTALQMGDFSKVMGAIAPTAYAAGQGLESTIAAVGMLKNVGMTTLGATEKLRMMLTSLNKAASDPTTKQVEVLKSLKLELRDTSGKMKEQIQIYREVHEKTKNLTPATRDAALSNLFGAEALQGFNAIMNQSIRIKGEDIIKSRNLVKGTEAYKKAMDEQVTILPKLQKENNSWANALKNNWHIMVNGEAVLAKDYLAKIKAAKGQKAYNQMLERGGAVFVKNYKAEVMTLGDAIKQNKEITLKGADALDYNTVALKKAQNTAKEFNEKYLATTKGKLDLMSSAWDAFSRKLLIDVGPAIGFVGNAITMLLSETTVETPQWIIGIKVLFQSFKPVIDAVKSGFSSLWSSVSGGGEKSKNQVSSFVVIAAQLGSKISSLAPVVTTLFDALTPVVSVLIDVMSFAAKTGFIELAVGVFAGVKAFTMLKSAIMGIKTAFMAMKVLVATNPILLAVTVIAGLAYLIYNNWSGIKAFFIDIFGGAGDYITEKWGQLKNWFGGLIGTIKNIFSVGWETGIIPILLGPVGIVIRYWDRIKTYFFKSVNFIKQIFIKGWQSGIIPILLGPVGLVIRYWSQIKTFFKALLINVQIRFFKAKNFIINSFVLLKKGAINIFKGFLNYLLGMPKKIINGFKNIGSGMMNVLSNGITKNAGKAINAVFGVAKRIRGFFNSSDAKEGPLSTTSNAGMALPTTLAKGVNAKAYVFKDAVSDVTNSIGSIKPKVTFQAHAVADSSLNQFQPSRFEESPGLPGRPNPNPSMPGYPSKPGPSSGGGDTYNTYHFHFGEGKKKTVEAGEKSDFERDFIELMHKYNMAME